MKSPLCLLMLFVGVSVLASPSPCRAHPASRVSIEWATANSDLVIVGKVIKVEKVGKHDIVTVVVNLTLRCDQVPIKDALNPKLTFVLHEYCSGYAAQKWLEDGLPMMFFLVKIDGAKRRDQLPRGFKWVLHDNGSGNSAVALGKTNQVWPVSMDVFTRKFEYLTDPAVIVKFVSDYSRSIPPRPN